KEKSFDGIRSMPASCCVFQLLSRILSPACNNSSALIFLAQYASLAFFNSRNAPTLGYPKLFVNNINIVVVFKFFYRLLWRKGHKKKCTQLIFLLISSRM